jgi:hypothetical protein
LEAGFLATSTGPFPLETPSGLQQLLKNLGAHLVCGGTNAHFDCFQVDSATQTPSLEDHLQ